jgi:hypothetical protein
MIAAATALVASSGSFRLSVFIDPPKLACAPAQIYVIAQSARMVRRTAGHIKLS